MNSLPAWLDIVAIILLFTLSVFLIYKNIKYKINYNTLGNLHIQALSDNYFLNEALKKLNQEIENLKLQETDGFVKFLSTSRDWAFNYIEEVQYALKEFDEVIAPIAEWNKTYGTILGENLYSPKIEEISLAYERLKSLLPKDNETPNN